MASQNLLPPPMLRSFQSQPADALHSFAASQLPPFGLPAPRQRYVPSPEAYPGKQPVYHLRVSATPVSVPNTGETTYVITSGSPEGVQTTTTEHGPVVAHAAPDLRHLSENGLTVRPLAYQQIAVTPPQQFERQVTNNGILLGGEQAERAFISVYRGRPKSTRAMVERSLPDGLPETPRTLVGLTDRTGEDRHLDVALLDAHDSNHPRHYSWLLPAESASAPEPPLSELEAAPPAVPEVEPERPPRDSRRGSSRSRRASSRKDAAAASFELFRNASKAFRAKLGLSCGSLASDAGDWPVGEERLVNEAGDDELGLPADIRPRVRYGGCTYLPPLYGGERKPLSYRIHAIELHQYLPLPNSSEPWFEKQKLDPTVDAIFGPMPLPFDPAQSGMVAPTFNETPPVPRISDKFSQMFNQELPIMLEGEDTSYASTTSDDEQTGKQAAMLGSALSEEEQVW